MRTPSNRLFLVIVGAWLVLVGLVLFDDSHAVNVTINANAGGAGGSNASTNLDQGVGGGGGNSDPGGPDGDGDGMSDSWEISNGTDPNRNDAEEDGDEDGLTNLVESKVGTYPWNPYSDDDTLKDGDDAVPTDGKMTVSAASEANYAIIDLGRDWYPTGINDRGEVVLRTPSVERRFWSQGDTTLIASGNGPSKWCAGPLQDGSVYYYVEVTTTTSSGPETITNSSGTTTIVHSYSTSPLIGGGAGGYFSESRNHQFNSSSTFVRVPWPENTGDLGRIGVSQKQELDLIYTTAEDSVGDYLTEKKLLSGAVGKSVVVKSVNDTHSITFKATEDLSGIRPNGPAPFLDPPWTLYLSATASLWGYNSDKVLGSSWATGRYRPYAPLDQMNPQLIGSGGNAITQAYVNNDGVSAVVGSLGCSVDGVIIPGCSGIDDLNMKTTPEGPYVLGKSASIQKIWTLSGENSIELTGITVNAGETFPGFNDRMVGRKVSNQLVVPAGDKIWRNSRAREIRELCGSPSDYLTIYVSQVSPNNNFLIGFAGKDEDGNGALNFGDYPNYGPDYYHGVLLLPAELMVDSNHDGKMSVTDSAIHGKDITTKEKPFRFWINDDVDKGGTVDGDDWEEDDQSTGNPDYQDGEILYRRDLEDFTRLWINAYQVVQALGGATGLTAEVQWKPMEGDTWQGADGNPSIKLYKAIETDGGSKYLTEQDQEGYNQTQNEYKSSIGTVTKGTVYTFPANFLNGLTEENPSKYLLFEGAATGKGRLIVRIKKGQIVAELPPVYIELKSVKDMYETWTVGDVPEQGENYNIWPTASASKTTGENLPAPQTSQEKDYILFVHGWNMAPKDKDDFASTAFKRLWHQGYKGRFGAFRWPTFWFTTAVPHTDNFDGSEHRAWNSGIPLAGLISQLSQTFQEGGQSKVRLYAHSMGNIVASEALRQMAPTSKVHTYISAQAALSSHVWDDTTPLMPFTVGGNPFGGGPETPDVYGYYWQTGATSQPHEWESEEHPSYMAPQYMPNGVRYINHYNPFDWALSFGRWQVNQMLKPDVGYHYSIINLADLTDLNKRFWRDQTTKLNFPDDRFEIFSFAAESHSYATGQQGSTGGMFGAAVNLDEDPFSFGSAHKGHSGQFRSTIQKRWLYWKRVLDDMRLTVQ